MKETSTSYVSLRFEEVSLPPFRDILILAKKCPHGKQGISGCLSMLAPDEFELIEVTHPIIEAILVHRRILKKLPGTKIVELLSREVFPYISRGEAIKVDMNIQLTVDHIAIDLEGTKIL